MTGWVIPAVLVLVPVLRVLHLRTAVRRREAKKVAVEERLRRDIANARARDLDELMAARRRDERTHRKAGGK